MRISLLLLLLLGCYISPSSPSVRVYVDPSTNSNTNSECTSTGTSPDTFHCKSLVSAVSTVLNSTNPPPQNIDILLSTGITHYLTTPISITSIINITIGPAAPQEHDNADTSDDPLVTIVCSMKESKAIVPALQFPIAADFIYIHDVRFEKCPGGLFVNNASKFMIQRAEFRYFSNGALDIYNTIDIVVVNTSFKHNGPLTSYFKLHGRYVVHSGGLSMGADILDEGKIYSPGSPRIHIENCSFINNSAIPSDALQQTLTQVFIRELFTGRGGGLGLALNSPLHPYSVVIRNCSFVRNFAKLLGGAVYITLGWATSHDIVFDSNMLIENESGFAGGATFLGSFGPGTQTKFDSIVFKDCMYIRNKAERGGGAVYAVPGTQGAQQPVGIWNYMLFNNCDFICNEGVGYAAALWLASVDPYATQFNHKPVEIVDCTFMDNSAPDSTIMGTLFVPIFLSGHNTFVENQGSSLELFGSVADFTGTIEFLSTDSELSNIGALHLVSFAQILLHEGVTILFKNNSGKFGGSITTVSESPWEGFSHLTYNPLCFLLYEDDRTPPDQWNVNVSFVDNTAVVGSVGFLDSSSSCSWSQHEPPYFNSSSVLNWSPFNQINNSNTFHVEDEYNQIYNTQTYPVRIIISNKIVHAYLGEVFALDIHAYDELNHTVGIAVTLAVNTTGSLHFSPSAGLLLSNDRLLYTKVSSLNGPVMIDQDFKVEVRGFNQKTAIQSASFVLKLKECPPGYILQQDTATTTKCLCTIDNDDVLHCTGTMITLNKQVWATKDSSSVDHISTFNCPPGYCRCIRDENGACVHSFDSIDPDNQCTCHRSGILCGECNETDSSLTVLSFSCVSNCIIKQWSMTAIIIAWGVIICASMVIIVRVFIHQLMPSTLFPILYYIQLLSIGLSSTTDGFNPVFIYLYYVYSALSFYFPYDFCFRNIGPVLLYSFRFLPLLLSTIVIPITLLLSWKWLKASNRPWYSVWLVFLLLYSHSLSSAISVLFCPSIPDDDTLRLNRWYMAGQVECFSGYHLLLTVLALIVILVCFLGILGTLVMPVLTHRYQLPFILKRLIESLIDFHSTKDHWFYSYDLFRRFVPTVMAITFQGNIYSIFIVFLLVNGVIVYRRPYQSTASNNIESLLLVTTSVMYMILLQGSSVITIDGNDNEAAECSAYESVSLSTILIALLYYVPVILGAILLVMAVFNKLKKHIKSNQLSVRKEKSDTRKPSEISIMSDNSMHEQGSFLSAYVKDNFTSTTVGVSAV